MKSPAKVSLIILVPMLLVACSPPKPAATESQTKPEPPQKQEGKLDVRQAADDLEASLHKMERDIQTLGDQAKVEAEGRLEKLKHRAQKFKSEHIDEKWRRLQADAKQLFEEMKWEAERFAEEQASELKDTLD